MSGRSRKLWIWVVGVVIAAGVVAFVRSRAGGDELVVQLADKETGKPLSDVRVTIEEFHCVAVLYELRFLPRRLRSRTTSRIVESADGTFRIHRVSQSWDEGAEFNVSAKGYGKARFFYYPTGIDVGRPASDIHIQVPLKARAVVVPVDRAEE